MITTKKLFSALVALTMSIVMVSCAGEDGETGPAGPAGNANVISNTYPIAGGTWSAGRNTISVPGLTQDIADNGQVAVFISTDTLGTDTITWNALPHKVVVNFGQGGEWVTISNSYSIGEVVVSAIRNNNGTGVNFTNNFIAKVVLIPSNSNMEGVDPTDYKALEAVYGLE